MIAIFGTLHLNPPQRDEALREFRHVVDDTRREQGCWAYVVSADLVDPNILYIFEEWADADALDAHRRSEHFAAHQARSAGHLLAAEINQYEATSADRRTMGHAPAREA